MNKIILIIACVFFLSFPALSQNTVSPGTPSLVTESSKPQFIPKSRFGKYANFNTDPTDEKLSSDEDLVFQNYVKKLPPFPRYLYSGCHDRAHAAYIQLPDNLKKKINKVWVISPGKYSAGLYGLIGLKGNEGSGVTWGYHVALAYKNDKGLQVFDLALSPNKTMPVELWFEQMSIPNMSFWTLTGGKAYLFSTVQTDNNSLNDPIWNGNVFEYDSTGNNRHFIPEALARDSVGVAILEQEVCNEMKSDATNPDRLLTRLQKNDIPAQCQKIIDLFKNQKTEWTKKLSIAP